MLEIGSVIDGKYKILNQIGKGGMSVVYLAMNERANKQWAVKEVRKDGVQDFEIVRQGLIVEMEMLKRLRHPYLPTIIDVIDTDDSFLIVMDYIEGKPLSRALAEYGALPQEYVIEWARQLCEVLGYLHTREKPIIYRDLKPENIMLRPDGSITLIDFGIAREYKEYATHDTRALGTQGYAAPEQFGGQGQTDARTDIYGLGTTLYHLVTGYNPSEPPYEIFPIRHWNPSLSQGLEQIIWKCIQRNPKDRYQSCAEILYALEHYQDLDNRRSLKLKLKLVSFLTMTVLTVGLSMTSFWAYYTKTTMVTQSYDAYIEDGRSGATAEEQFGYYEKAVQLMPGKQQAYLDMIDRLYLGDDILTAEEDRQLRTLLIRKTGSGKTYEEELKENSQGYEELAYKLGIAYFYSYEDQGNKAMSTKWLTIAANAASLNESQVQRAAKLGKIAEYYAKLGVESKSGDDNISYADYWIDLCQVTEGNIAQMDNATTALMVYREMVYQIYVNGMKFKKAGVSKEELQGQLDNVRERLKTDIGADASGNERLQALFSEVQGNLEQAQRVLDDYDIWNGEGQ
ncbi:MAG: serine/threonine protein kinase [Lachnospiraceae bacterium]|nr:serine/threonine protein kinase [Lachnospiraceae bacterium]